MVDFSELVVLDQLRSDLYGIAGKLDKTANGLFVSFIVCNNHWYRLIFSVHYTCRFPRQYDQTIGAIHSIDQIWILYYVHLDTRNIMFPGVKIEK